MAKKINIENYIEDNTLDMSLLQLTEIPVKNKKNLPMSVTCMNFSNNQLVSIPPIDAEQDEKLIHLHNYLKHPALCVVPSLCLFIQIRELNLSKNKLKTLPDQFGDMVNLTKLDLYDNQLSFLPLSFHKLRKLIWLDISSNPFPKALMTLAGPCQDAKECKYAAITIVKYFGVLNNEVIQEYEKAKQAEKEKQINTDLVVKSDPPKLKKLKNKNMDNKNVIKSDEVEISQSGPATGTVVVKTGRIPSSLKLFLRYAGPLIIILIIYFMVNNVELSDIILCLVGDKEICSKLLQQ